MMKFSGIGASSGIAIGTLHFYKSETQAVIRSRIEEEDVQTELARVETARAAAIDELSGLYETALKQVGEQGAMLFEIHQMMLEDEDYCESIESIITNQRVNAEYAVAVTGDNFSGMFAGMEDSYMQARASDVKDISERLIKILSGRDTSARQFDEPVILAAIDLAPSETVQLDKDKILAFVTVEGSNNSHTAILARTMGIPAIIKLGNELSQELDGKLAGMDRTTGELVVDPDSETLQKFQAKQEENIRKKQLLEQLKGMPAETGYGQRVLTYANIGSTTDLGAVLLNDAEGIGLFRTEFLYLESDHYPTESEQFNVYRKVVESMTGKRVIFRTLDIGADKQAAYFELPPEENPAMGLRAIRICLTREHVFKEQLRALLRASYYGKLAIMFPMITSLWEIREIKRILAETKQELWEAEVPFAQDIEIGVMIETPAAVMVSNQLAKEVDFFSVGTNDLTQYLLAVDRQNQNLARFYDPYHPALLEMIRIASNNAHKHGKWIGICGELAADLAMTETFLAFGIDELSVAPAAVLPLREKIRSLQTDSRDAILQEQEAYMYE